MKFKVVQNRKNFTRSWTEYKAGFGEVTGNYWIGKLPNKSRANHSLTCHLILNLFFQKLSKTALNNRNAQSYVQVRGVCTYINFFIERCKFCPFNMLYYPISMSSVFMNYEYMNFEL